MLQKCPQPSRPLSALTTPARATLKPLLYSRRIISTTLLTELHTVLARPIHALLRTLPVTWKTRRTAGLSSGSRTMASRRVLARVVSETRTRVNVGARTAMASSLLVVIAVRNLPRGTRACLNTMALFPCSERMLIFCIHVVLFTKDKECPKNVVSVEQSSSQGAWNTMYLCKETFAYVYDSNSRSVLHYTSTSEVRNPIQIRSHKHHPLPDQSPHSICHADQSTLLLLHKMQETIPTHLRRLQCLHKPVLRWSPYARGPQLHVSADN